MNNTSHDDHVQKIKRDSVHESRDPVTRTLLLILALLLFALIGVVSVYGYLAYQSLSDNVTTQKHATGVAVGTADTNKSAAEKACAQVEKLGKHCAVDTKQLDTGREAVKQAVGAQGVQGIQGIQGVQGIPGPVPSTNFILALVRQVIAENPPKDGQQGPQGIQGLPGATPSTDTLLNLIRQALADNPPKDGKPGRGIAQLDCSGSLTPLTLTVTFDDGETEAIQCDATP